MSTKTSIAFGLGLLPVAAALLLAGCQSSTTQSVPALAAPSATAHAQSASTVVRIKAGSPSPYTDSSGNVWAADAGFTGGDVAKRPNMNVANASDPGLFHSEHYGMTAFSWPLVNGKYLVKLYFAETYEGVDGPRQRVFSFNVQGRDFKDFDVFVKAGGRNKAYVESVPVEINNGKLLITFNDQIEYQEINAIEIIPQP
jgi:hypothetical protein